MPAHLVQADSAWENKAENCRRVDALLAGVAVAPGDLIVLPEMFDTGFSFRLDVTADRDEATLGYLRGLARRTRAVVHGSRTVIGPDGRGRNRASILGPEGTVLAEYDKIHPFSFGKESDFFSGGEKVVAYPWHGGADSTQRTVVCPAICYDLRFPELFRRGMTMGAEVFAIGANWPAPRALHRETLARARAIENQAVVLCVNRAGSDPHLTDSGGTMAFGPKGDTLGQLADGPGVLTVEIDLAGLRAWRDAFPAWKDAKLL